MNRVIFTSVVIVFLSACASSYYGYDKATWDDMSLEEKESVISDVNSLLNYGREVSSQNAETQSIIDRAGIYSR